ncbi:SRPBCC family protein [Shewanella sp. ZOR0012]|uniref:SRPBCC family protein n=1 Tax=Shewanella TaxID=22 RepID=UPI000646FA94|nr:MULTISPECIES: SRPBCC family protein [Shewanella]MEE1982427.1 SRPBCC family protein [Shewanella xiamenensis]NSM24330.1 SRPBCC family protein [Shewanella sp. ZOR0012]TVL36049.1 activator of HSP90 ATPase [Shewanella xiamenensis]
MSDNTGTVRLHRVLRAPAALVYKAFTDKAALERWLPPYGFVGAIHEFELAVGAGYSMSFTQFVTGYSHSFKVTYTELIPNKLIRHSDQFDDANLPGVMQVTIELAEVACGTRLQIVQEGIPAIIPEEMCYLGWQESLLQLAALVEAKTE